MTDSEKPPSARAQRVAVVYNTDYNSLDIADEEAEPPSRAADAEVAETARAVRRSLEAAGHDVVTMTVSDSLDELPERLADAGVDVVFNLVESLGGDPHREAELPALLDRMDLCYTGNGAAALGIAHAKDIARARLTRSRIPVAAGFAVEDADRIARGDWSGLRFPLFVKPARTDASIGIDQGSIVHDVAALRRRLEWLAGFVPGPYVVEEYLPGREINVAIFPEPVRGQLVPTEIDFSGYPSDFAPIVTYDCKWVPDCPEAVAFSRPCADSLPGALLRRVIDVARGAFLAIGGTSYGRVDMRLDARGLPRVIDVNPNPDIHPDAGLCIAAQSVGMDHSILVTQLVAEATVKVADAVQADSKRRSRTARRALGARR